MKKIILILIVAMSLFSCKKGEKCLVSGTWTADKVVSLSGVSIDGKTTLKFKDNGYIDYGGEIDFVKYSADNNIITFGNTSYNYRCKGKKLEIDGDLQGVKYNDPVAMPGITTYLSK